MTEKQIAEMKECIAKELVKNYGMSEADAVIAIQESYFSTEAAYPNTLINHDSIEEWAKFIHEEKKDLSENCDKNSEKLENKCNKCKWFTYDYGCFLCEDELCIKMFKL